MNYPITPKKIRKFLSLKRLLDFEIEFDSFMDLFAQTEKKHIDVFDTCMHLYRLKSKKQYWCEKTPQNLKYLKQIFEYYPDAKVICIIRDGRDVALSLSKTPWREKNIAIPSLEWNEYVRRFIEAQTLYSEKNFLALKFEELVQHPEKIFMLICNFLGIDFESSLLNPPQNIPGLVPHWEITWKGNVIKHFDRNAIGRWKCIPNDLQKKTVNSIMKSNLQKLKYDYIPFHTNIFEKFQIMILIIIAKILKPIFEFIEFYSGFRSEKYHFF